MQITNEDADEKVRKYVLWKYQRTDRENYHEPKHLHDCPSIRIVELDAFDGSYGCDTGCEYYRFESTITCDHGETDDYTWGQFGELAMLLEDLETDEF
jgi:hypothetical protein